MRGTCGFESYSVVDRATRDKFRVYAFPCLADIDIVDSKVLSAIPLYISEELDGDCTVVQSNVASFFKVVSSASDVDLLIFDGRVACQRHIAKIYHRLSPIGRIVSYSAITGVLLRDRRYSDRWTKPDFMRWINNVLLPEIGFAPIAEAMYYL